jgi:3-dehydroquinate synthase
VAIGMVAESKLSERIGIAEPGLSDALSNLLRKLALPVHYQAPAEKILEHVATDKKRRGGRIKWALPITPGKVRVGLEVPEEDVRQSLNAIGCRS